MTTSEQVNEIAAAMVRAQQELKPAAKDKLNPVYKSPYSDLATIIEVSRVFAKYGIAIMQQATLVKGEGAAVTTRLLHDRGQWVEFDPLVIPVQKWDAHGVSSGVTYAKRVSLCASLCIASENERDDDANAAVGLAQPVKHLEPAPDGYDQWFNDLVAVADTGTDALRDMYRKSQPYYRKHLEESNPGQIEKLKKRAASVKPQAVPA